MTNEHLMTLPAQWVWTVAKDVCTKIQDGTHFSPKNQGRSGDRLYVTAKNVRPHGLDLSDVTFIDEHQHQEIYARCDPRYGDVLLVKDGVNTGDAAINTLHEEFSLLSSVCFLRPMEGMLDSKFLRYFLLSPFGYRSLTGQMSGTAIKRIVLHRIRDLPIPLAPLPEQRRIVAEIETQLSRLDAAVAALGRARANLRRYRAAVLAEAVSGGWGEQPLGSIAEIQGGIQKQPKRAPVHNAYPFLRVANVLRGRLDLTDVHRIELFDGELDRLRLRAGDLLIVEGNGSPSEIGRLAIWDGSIADCVHQNHLIRVRPSEGLTPKFAAIYWNSPVGQRRVQDVASSTTGLYTLSVRKISSLPIPVPPLEEQSAIVAEVERRLSVVEASEAAIAANLARAEKLRQAVLRKAFAGELVAQDPSDEPAAALLERIKKERAVTGGGSPRRGKRAARQQPLPLG